jgi:hypothetical protein
MAQVLRVVALLPPVQVGVQVVESIPHGEPLRPVVGAVALAPLGQHLGYDVNESIAYQIVCEPVGVGAT